MNRIFVEDAYGRPVSGKPFIVPKFVLSRLSCAGQDCRAFHRYYGAKAAALKGERGGLG